MDIQRTNCSVREEMTKRLEIVFLLLSLFTFTFSKHLLVKVDEKGADENNVDDEVEDEMATDKLNRQAPGSFIPSECGLGECHFQTMGTNKLIN